MYLCMTDLVYFYTFLNDIKHIVLCRLVFSMDLEVYVSYN